MFNNQSLPIVPTPSVDTAARGIFQSDLIVRSAVIECLNEILANPSLLDYVFIGLKQDDLTKANYGEQDIQKAKDWFLNTNIKVSMDVALTHAEWPCISISLLDSNEAEFTIGDVHYVPYEGTFDDWPIIVNKFTPSAYSPSSGIMKIPADALGSVILDGAMVVIDAVGTAYPVLNVLDSDTIAIQPNVLGNFNSVSIKDGNPGLITPIERIRNKETYQLTLYCQGEVIHLIYLHSILTFALNRRKQDLLEARGFERSVMSSGRVERFTPTENEVVYARTINIVGYADQVWVKPTKQVVQGISNNLIIGKNGSTLPAVDDSGKAPGPDTSWTVEIGSNL